MHLILVPDQIRIPDEPPLAEGALVAPATVMALDVLHELALGGEDRVTLRTRQPVRDVGPPVRHQVALHGELLLAQLAAVGPQAGVDAFVRVQTGLLREALLADVALEGALPRVRPQVHLQQIERVGVVTRPPVTSKYGLRQKQASHWVHWKGLLPECSFMWT